EQALFDLRGRERLPELLEDAEALRLGPRAIGAGLQDGVLRDLLRHLVAARLEDRLARGRETLRCEDGVVVEVGDGEVLPKAGPRAGAVGRQFCAVTRAARVELVLDLGLGELAHAVLCGLLLDRGSTRRGDLAARDEIVGDDLAERRPSALAVLGRPLQLR